MHVGLAPAPILAVLFEEHHNRLDADLLSDEQAAALREHAVGLGWAWSPVQVEEGRHVLPDMAGGFVQVRMDTQRRRRVVRGYLPGPLPNDLETLVPAPIPNKQKLSESQTNCRENGAGAGAGVGFGMKGGEFPANSAQKQRGESVGGAVSVQGLQGRGQERFPQLAGNDVQGWGNER